MLYLLLSIFGLFVSDQFVYRLEILKFIFPRFRKVIYVVLNLPSIYFLFFKEHYYLFSIYIGLILLSLMFLNIYFELFLKKTFMKAQIRVLDAISLNIKAGQSPIKSAKITFGTLTSIEKIIFEPLNHLQSELKVPIYAQQKFSAQYFDEINFIFRSQTKVSDQIDQYKKGLRIQNNLRHKSRLSTLQVRSQAIVAVVIYILLMCFSLSELQLGDYPKVIAASTILMAIGVWVILLKGEKIKWTI